MICDNWYQGGLAVGIDLKTGCLLPKAYYKSPKSNEPYIERHPDTGVEFDGYQLPYWPEVLDLVRRAALSLGDLLTLGWDVAIGENGPFLVEANEFWGTDSLQTVAGGLRDTSIGRHAAKLHGLPWAASTEP